MSRLTSQVLGTPWQLDSDVLNSSRAEWPKARPRVRKPLPLVYWNLVCGLGSLRPAHVRGKQWKGDD